ncbi:hypothetical protein H0H87_010831 [Tephrocybe sp. NHM501043]|nr:hypothetical protein H0H87_010831 [Tephrocybe sp. NHM501043]
MELIRTGFTILLLFIALAYARAPAGPWDKFNYAPKSKTVYPSAIHSQHGEVQNAQKLVGNAGVANLAGKGSWVALDFGIEVGGLISLTFPTTTSTSAISLSFTESPTFIRPSASDDSSYPSANTTYDGVLRLSAPLPVNWTQPSATLRGGFRFLTIVSDSDQPVSVAGVQCAISFMPHVDDLRAYNGYFYAYDPVFHDPDFLTKGVSPRIRVEMLADGIEVWYAGAYTVQTNTVPLNTGRKVPFAPAGSKGFNNVFDVQSLTIITLERLGE